MDWLDALLWIPYPSYRKKQDISAVKVQVHAEWAKEFPKVFTHITLEYIVEGRNIDPKAVERSIQLSATNYCSAQAMLSNVCKIERKYSILDQK